MVIEKAESSEKLKKIIEEELERHEAKCGVDYQYAPFSFLAKEDDEIVGAVMGFTCYAEVYISELAVMEKHRGKSIGTQLLKAVEAYYKQFGLNNINLCTNEFQAPAFYEKAGFQLEFVRKNKDNPKLNKYFYVKFFNEE